MIFNFRTLARAGCLVCFVLFISQVSAQNLMRGPYLQKGSHTAITVDWRTDSTVVGRVRYGTNLADLNLTTDETSGATDHQVTLTNLLPDTKYFYLIGNGPTTL